MAVAIFIAQKLLEDTDLWFIPQFAVISCIPEDLLEALEVEFCLKIGFKLNVTQSEFENLEFQVVFHPTYYNLVGSELAFYKNQQADVLTLETPTPPVPTLA